MLNSRNPLLVAPGIPDNNLTSDNCPDGLNLENLILLDSSTSLFFQNSTKLFYIIGKIADFKVDGTIINNETSDLCNKVKFSDNPSQVLREDGCARSVSLAFLRA